MNSYPILRFVARRILYSLFLLLGVSVMSFVFIELAPGDFFDEMRLNPQISQETIASLRAEFGLDRSLPVRYVRWLRSAALGDLGFSFAHNSPAAPLLWSRAQNTLLLTITATLLAWCVALPLGVWSAGRRGSRSDLLFGGVTSTLLAIPDLVLALVLLLAAVRTGALPAGGMTSTQFSELGVAGKAADLASHLLLPVLALVLMSFPAIASHVRSAVSESLNSPFILAACARGISGRRLLFFHALPAAANPIISLSGLSIATLLSASLLVEAVMGWPGLGRLLLDAILARDLHIVIGSVLFSTLFLVVGNLLADVLLFVNDPRIRTE